MKKIDNAKKEIETNKIIIACLKQDLQENIISPVLGFDRVGVEREINFYETENKRLKKYVLGFL